MKKILMISFITGICLMLLRCKKDDPARNNGSTNDDHSYQLILSFDYESWPAATFNWRLTDTATLNIDVTNGIVSTSDILNKEGSVSPTTQSIENGIESCIATWHKAESPSGYIHITIATGELYLGGNEVVMLSLHVTSSTAKTPKFTYVCSRSGSTETGANILEDYDYSYNFILNDQTQTQSYSILTATLIPD